MAREATACYWLLGCLYIISIVLFGISFIPKIRHSRSSGPCWALSAALFLIASVATLIVCCCTTGCSCFPFNRKSVKKLGDLEDDGLANSVSTYNATSKKISAKGGLRSSGNLMTDPEKAIGLPRQPIRSLGRATRSLSGHRCSSSNLAAPGTEQETDFMDGSGRRSLDYDLDRWDNHDGDLNFSRASDMPPATVRSMRNKLTWRQPELDAISERSVERSSGSFGPMFQQAAEQREELADNA